MAEIEQTKICPLCAETIKAAAKVCPHCRHWQRRWSLQNPQVFATIWVAIVIGALLCLVAFVDKIFGPKRDFAEYRDQIAVVSSQLSHRTSGSNSMVTVVGMVTNRSEFPWKDVGLEAQFFDREGKLIDVVIHAGDYGGFAILPRAEEAFRIEGKSARPQSEYASHKVTVRWAKDAGAWP